MKIMRGGGRSCIFGGGGGGGGGGPKPRMFGTLAETALANFVQKQERSGKVESFLPVLALDDRFHHNLCESKRVFWPGGRADRSGVENTIRMYGKVVADRKSNTFIQPTEKVFN